ncbi:MtnX-like HAD-IB family phosphatase [Zhaonella formicivorans]|uniref:MtnX-like HAD-IB family phosphatase n=1 Tax=Zhaonella formicivorans TaxID=2528593 RepID=UPI0010EAFAA8|nr:MtnX-like HAD-IB family phosphatase [Zhaonella formicivorans]
MKHLLDAARIYFVDFDGTITKQDTCAAMVQAFAGEGGQEIEARWERGEISTEECAKAIFDLFQASEEDWRELMSAMEIDETFQDFLVYCRSRQEELYILSDGYDLNIAQILSRFGLEDIPYFSNQLVIKGNKFTISCPHQEQRCKRCGTCKKSLLKKLNKQGKVVVYIGDGTSDICVAGEADILFAKGKLLDYCRQKGLRAIPFQSFGEVVAFLNNLK